MGDGRRGVTVIRSGTINHGARRQRPRPPRVVPAPPRFAHSGSNRSSTAVTFCRPSAPAVSPRAAPSRDAA